MPEEFQFAVLLIEMPARLSKPLIDAIKRKVKRGKSLQVLDAHPVCSEVDVIAILRASNARQLGLGLVRVLGEEVEVKGLHAERAAPGVPQPGISPTIPQSVRVFLLDPIYKEILEPPARHGEDHVVDAFVIVHFAEPPPGEERPGGLLPVAENFPDLLRSSDIDPDGVVYAAALRNRPRLLVRVQVKSVADFDRLVLRGLQGLPGAIATRSYVILRDRDSREAIRITAPEWARSFLSAKAPYPDRILAATLGFASETDKGPFYVDDVKNDVASLPIMREACKVLVDRGHITLETKDGRKVFFLTHEGILARTELRRREIAKFSDPATEP